MSKLIIKISSNDPKVVNMDADEIQKYKNKLIDKKKKSKDMMYFKIQNREVLEYLRQFVDELNLNILILYSSYMLFKYLKNDSKIIFQRGKLQL